MIKERERAARLGLAGAMITEYPLEHRRYDRFEYELFWAAAPSATSLVRPIYSGEPIAVIVTNIDARIAAVAELAATTKCRDPPRRANAMTGRSSV